MNPDLKFGALFKPMKGSSTLKRREKRAELVSHERAEMTAAKVRDHYRCRWPNCEFRTKQLPIEAAHIFQHRGSGGDPSGERTERKLIASLCKIHHGLLDRAELDIQAMTDEKADGPLAFFVRADNGRLEHFCSERLIGVPETRT
jgi:hypothetical protein